MGDGRLTHLGQGSRPQDGPYTCCLGPGIHSYILLDAQRAFQDKLGYSSKILSVQGRKEKIVFLKQGPHNCVI